MDNRTLQDLPAMRAEGPGKHYRLNANVGCGLMNHPAAEAFEIACDHQGVKDDQSPGSNPVYDPHASEAAEKVGSEGIAERRLPDQESHGNGDNSRDQSRKPGSHAHDCQQKQQYEHGNERSKQCEPRRPVGFRI